MAQAGPRSAGSERDSAQGEDTRRGKDKNKQSHTPADPKGSAYIYICIWRWDINPLTWGRQGHIKVRRETKMPGRPGQGRAGPGWAGAEGDAAWSRGRAGAGRAGPISIFPRQGTEGKK